MGYNGVKWGKGEESAAMLMGEYQHTIDVKGRLFMPAKLRETLGGSFIISKGLDGCLFVYDKIKQILNARETSFTNYNWHTFKRMSA